MAALKVKSKRNIQSYRITAEKGQFPTDSQLQIRAADCPSDITVLEILGEGEAPLPSCIPGLEWVGPFPNIKKVFFSDVELGTLTLEKSFFVVLENVTLKNVSFQKMTLEDFIQTLPPQLKSLSIINCGPFGSTEKWSKKLLPHLEQLDLSRNQLRKLPTWVQDLAALKRLTLDSNQLEALPLYLKNLPKLNHLSLDGNPFSDEARVEIQKNFNLWF